MATTTSDAPGPVVGGDPARRPARDIKLVGKYVTLVGLSNHHADAFFPYIRGAENAALWDYLPEGPYDDINEFRASIGEKVPMEDPVFYAILPAGNADGAEVVGLASLNAIEPKHRRIEAGIMMSQHLQRTPATTEALYMLTRYAFDDLGYRRYEWKCDARNAPSRRTALRLGFTLEGIFRKHGIVKGRNRDSAAYAILDDEWPGIKTALEAWLSPENFDEKGIQRKTLAELRS
ncbi:putative acetyltransferase, GNAT family [Xylariomycetidae sp. FL2044]|nr:putative acetyltransferase, GNAT family [Xylariomycetidae sp. FL2044]